MGRRKYTDEEILSELRRVDEMVDGSVSQPEFGELSDMGRSTVANRFGGWNTAKKMANLGTNVVGFPQDDDALRKCRKEAKVEQVKERCCCRRCGEDFPSVAMDFHHTRGDKSRNVSQMAHYKWENIKEELRKCEILCANCHRIVEYLN